MSCVSALHRNPTSAQVSRTQRSHPAGQHERGDERDENEDEIELVRRHEIIVTRSSDIAAWREALI